jgi:hypothetical protein
MQEPEQAAAILTPQSIATTDFNAVYASCMTEVGCTLNGETIATTIETGFFLKVILYMVYVVLGLGCCCCCMAMCCMRSMMKKKMENKSDARGH